MATDGTGLSVLLVDDDQGARTAARLALEHGGGIRVIEAASGAEALEAAARVLPDVVLVAAVMAGMDGPGVLRALRADPRTTGLGVIFLTSATMAGERDRLRSLGALAVIATPFDPASLPTRLRAALAGREAADAAGPASAASTAPPAADPAIDTRALLKLQGLTGVTGADLIDELIDLFAATTPPALRQLRELAAADGGATRDTVRIGHTLKGSALTLGATGIADLAAAIEALASEGRRDEIPPLVDRIDAMLKTTLEHLRLQSARRARPERAPTSPPPRGTRTG